MATTPSVAALLLLAASTASAAITIPTVSVGDAGNAADTTGYGAVAYDYQIGTYEVTNRQYTAFLNAVAADDTHGLWNSGMSITKTNGTYSTTVPNEPVAYTSFWDGARFANWLTNGQPKGMQGNGTTEDGMYNLGGVTNPTNTSVSRQLDFSLGQNGVAVASGNEWYKAAYYNGNGDYYDYPTQSDLVPNASGPTTAANSANFSNTVGSVTEIGAYTNSGSRYGTFDQGGNQNEWVDEIIDTSSRALRGGSFNGDSRFLQSSTSGKHAPTGEYAFVGFRVTSLAPIPEPSSYGAIFGIVGLATAIFFRRKRRRE